jgi:hypothetical protein
MDNSLSYFSDKKRRNSLIDEYQEKKRGTASPKPSIRDWGARPPAQ